MAPPAVVGIHAISRTTAVPDPLTDDSLFRQFFDTNGENSRQESSLGSGVILDPSGVILTNCHVVRGADAIRVSLQ